MKIFLMVVLGLLMVNFAHAEDINGVKQLVAKPMPIVQQNVGPRGLGFMHRQQSRALTAPVVLPSELDRIYFIKNKKDLHQSQMDKLAAMSRFMREHPDVRILLTGNCSAGGTAQYNMQLGLDRASTVKSILTFGGVAPERIFVDSKGKSALVYTGQEAFQNQRVDIKIL